MSDKRKPSSCLQLVQEDNGKARVLCATGGLVQEVTEHEQVVYGTRALDREPEKNDMGVKQKAALRSPLDYGHGVRGQDGQEGAASSQPSTEHSSRRGQVSKGYHLRGSCWHHDVLSSLAFHPTDTSKSTLTREGKVSMLSAYFHCLLL